MENKRELHTQVQIEELLQRLRFLELIVENSCDEVYVTDSKGMTILANPASEQHYGVTVEELIGKSVWELEQRGVYFPAVTPIVLREKKRVTIDQETGIGKTLMITATPVFDEKGEIEYVICNSRDITALEDMKKTLNKLRNNILKSEVISKNDNLSLYPVYSPYSVMTQTIKQSLKIASTDCTVLLLGESGTGKDLLAHYIHELSPRRDKQFLKINCAALPKELIESELFGYKKGAFTGANPEGKVGLFQLASGGTIFLDEIGELPLRLQPKLLQVIEEHTFTPIGSKSPEKVDVRIISSTNQDLQQMIAKGRFRDDLYYRLHVLSINIPPLRNRKDDLPLLADHFLKLFSSKHKRNISICDDTFTLLKGYDWPGNVRELKHLLEYLVVVVEGNTVETVDLPTHILEHSFPGEKAEYNNMTLKNAMEALERELIISSYKDLGSSYKVAKKLGISQTSANRRIRKYLHLKADGIS